MAIEKGQKAFGELKEYYRGFFIRGPVGNNAFSFEFRAHQQIFVPPLIEGSLREARAGTEVVFREIRDGTEYNVCGLERFVYWHRPGKHVFIFDNHNHAFSFWAFGVFSGILPAGLPLVHVDQHKDMRRPAVLLEKEFWRHRTLCQACDYANRELNVGNFIVPALEAGIFSRVNCVDSETALDGPIPDACAADIDLDFFSPDMDYIPFERRLNFVRGLVEKSAFVTIATSPYFVDQDRALEILNRIIE
jgi:hypothetical protein